MQANERLYLTRDGKALVREGDPKGATLYAAPGDEIPESAVRMFGLAGGGLRKPAAAPAAKPPAAKSQAKPSARRKAKAGKKASSTKEAPPAEDKELKPAEDKDGGADQSDAGAGAKG